MQFDLKNATLRIKDGSTPTANYITVKFRDGTFTWSEKTPREYLKDRGVLDGVRNGDQEPMDIKIDAAWERITAGTGSGATPTIRDALYKEGGAAAWESTDADACAPYAVDLELRDVRGCGAEQDEIITFPDFRIENFNADAKNGMLSIDGKCNAVHPTPVRQAQSS